MEVTRSNFKEALPVISKAIEDSSFIAIDAEFSGLTAGKRGNAMDTCDERYQKLINGVKDFTIMQFGICTFSWNDKRQQYIAKQFNFYIFPKRCDSKMPDVRFLCQSSSLDFLAGQGFDFNKWITQGIPFLLPSDEDRLRQMVGAYHGRPGPKEKPMPIPPAFEKTIECIMKKVEKLIEDPEQKSLRLPPLSPLVHKLVYSSVKAAHKTGLHLESKKIEDGDEYIMITNCSEEEKNDIENKKFAREQAVGFTKVICLLSQSGKVILGHNMLLDLLHTIRLFIAPLPDNLDSFKALVKGVLPRLIDTKVMASTEPLKGHFPRSHLQAVYNKSSEAPFVKPNVLFAEGFGDYFSDLKAHEAGFDAYMTGVAFIAMAAFLEKRRDGSAPCGEMDFEIFKPFLNKIFLFPRMKDIPYLNLDDFMPSRDHVFHIKHPATSTRTSAFVSVAKREQATRVMQKLGKGDVPYTIQTYNEYHGFDDGDDDFDFDSSGDDGGKDGTDAHGSFLNESHTDTPSLDTPSKTPETVSSKRMKDDISSSEVEDGEPSYSPTEPSYSPAPAPKKLKSQDTYSGELMSGCVKRL